MRDEGESELGPGYQGSGPDDDEALCRCWGRFEKSAHRGRWHAGRASQRGGLRAKDGAERHASGLRAGDDGLYGNGAGRGKQEHRARDDKGRGEGDSALWRITTDGRD